MCDSLWLDRAEWISDDGSPLPAAAPDGVLSLRTAQGTTCWLRAPRHAATSTILRLHPVLHEYLSLASDEEEEEDPENEDRPVEILPLPLPGLAPPTTRFVKGNVRILSAYNEIPLLPSQSSLSQKIIHDDVMEPPCRTDAEATIHGIRRALTGRIISRGSVLLLQRPSLRNVYTLVLVQDLAVTSDLDAMATSPCYRIGTGTEYSIRLLPPPSPLPPPPDPSPDSTNTAASSSSADCPGYAVLQASLRRMLQLAPHPAAPSGLLLTGSAGVGKTRLLRSILMSLSSSLRYHYVSMQEVRLRLAFSEATVESWLQAPEPCTLLIFDDLQVLSSSSSNTTNVDDRWIWNGLLQIMDRNQQQQASQSRSLVIGLTRDAATLPPELLRAGRFEVQMAMPPPTQQQREVILYHLLQSASGATSPDDDADTRPPYRDWAPLLATVTAGCVASDLRRLCADAWSRCMARLDATAMGDASQPPLTWDDLADAARRCTPSQLAMLDVTKPKDYFNVCALDDWPEIHRRSWEPLAGYAAVKQRLYRTVVVPWRRQMQGGPRSIPDAKTIVPPSGILFHGPSGCGKTLAANCLGSSLGLPMIKVRAADVLDQWLGGSEATLRSLFARARAAAPCILFLDELDALASNRSHGGEGSDVMSRLLSTFLNEMDGISNNPQSDSGILIVACTNRKYMLDAALLRPGRLEEHILLPLPTVEDALAIFQQKLAQAPVDLSLNWSSMAQRLVERAASGADVEGLCREAIFRAMRRCSGDDDEVMVLPEDLESAMVAMKLTKVPLESP